MLGYSTTLEVNAFTMAMIIIVRAKQGSSKSLPTFVVGKNLIELSLLLTYLDQPFNPKAF